MVRCAALTLLSTVVAGCVTLGAAPGDVLLPAEASISASAFREHMQVLAADTMQGREAGTEAYELAALYVAATFGAAGIEPLGDDGSYLQTLELQETRLAAGSASMVLHKAGADVTLEFGVDFVRSGGFGDLVEKVEAPLVFAGFGVQAPEYDHDDFAGMDVHGKVLVVLTGAPARFANDERAFYSSSATKLATAASLGALGIVTVITPIDRPRLPWSRYQSAIGSAEMRWTDASGGVQQQNPDLPGNAVLSESGARRLFELAGHSLDDIFASYTTDGVGGRDLGLSVTLTRSSVHRITRSSNVVGLLRGYGALSHEYLVMTAHLDHLGIGSGEEPDRIHNGAYDNAAGVAAILEVARAMTTLPGAPRRSVIFAAFTAEEKGFVGSDYFVNHPPVPVTQMVANINIDMPYLGFPISDIEAIGADHSTLQADLMEATARSGLTLTPDSKPELVRLIRSDQYSFVKKGIPGLNLKPGSKSADPAIDGERLLSNFLHEHYHRPSDDLSLPFSPAGADSFVRTALHLAILVASHDQRPAWNAGGFFARRFAPALDKQAD